MAGIRETKSYCFTSIKKVGFHDIVLFSYLSFIQQDVSKMDDDKIYFIFLNLQCIFYTV